MKALRIIVIAVVVVVVFWLITAFFFTEGPVTGSHTNNVPSQGAS